MHNSTPDSCERLLAGLIGYDTVNGHISGVPHPERKLAEYLEETARGLGFKAERLFLDADGFNLLVTHEVDRGRPWLLFESHLDTVTVEGMEIDPFQAKIENGRIYGRGACDTKGTGASMLWALKRYAAEAGGSNNIGILYSVDEEIGKSGAQKFVSDQLPALGWRPVGVVVGEPTLLKPVVSHNGVARWKIHTRGVAAHSSDPSQGRSAISTMVRVIDQIETDYVPSLEASHPLTGRAQCSVNVIRGGAQINVIPDHCEIEVDRRVVPGEDVNDVLPAVKESLSALHRQDPELEIEYTDMFLDPPLDPAGGQAFAAIVSRELEAMGLCGAPAGVRYGTDGSQFSTSGLPALVLGPGSIEQAHTKDEWLSLEQLRLGVEAYTALMHASWEELA